MHCTFFFEKEKKTVTVPARVGWTLLQTAEHHQLPLQGEEADDVWDYKTLGEGPNSTEDHVVIHPKDFDVVGPPLWQEAELLETLEFANVRPTSRLAAMVKLTPEMDGLTVLVPATNLDMSQYC